MLICKLEEVGINMADIKKLQDAGNQISQHKKNLIYLFFSGFQTIEAICFTAKKNMINIKGLTEAKIDKIIDASSKLVQLVNLYIILIKKPLGFLNSRRFL